MSLHRKDYDAVLFDAGNTILHLDYDYIASVVGNHGHRFEPRQFQIAEYAARAAVDRELAPDVVPPESVEGMLWGKDEARPSYFEVALRQLGIAPAEATELAEILRRHNLERCLWRVVLPDTASVLTEVKRRGLRLAVISNADGRVERDLIAAGVGEHFEFILDSSVVGVEKPDPRMFALALDRLGVTAARAIYVGDVYGIDVAGSRRAGLTPILIDRLGRYPRDLDCLRITELRELLTLLE